VSGAAGSFALRPRCTVRGCDQELAPPTDAVRAWRCARGHSFDVSRRGYVNLLQPNDKRSKSPGDAREAVEARARLEDADHTDHVADAVVATVAELGRSRPATALDVGACTGRLLARVAEAASLEAWALDLSTPAVDHGARRRPELAWIVANADRGLPFGDGAFGLVLSSAGPKNPPEFRRVLAPGGRLVLVVPGADDLVELRGALYGDAPPLDRVGPALAAFDEHFEPTSAPRTARVVRRLSREAVGDALAAAYRGHRASEQARAESALIDIERDGGLDVTLSAEVLVLAPRG